MRIRLCIPNEKYWLECTKNEAEQIIYPMLDSEVITLSKKVIKEFFEDGYANLAPDCAGFPACFNVSRDLYTIEPHSAIYPYHHMWNGYSPYQNISEVYITNFTELKDVAMVCIDEN